MAAGTQLEDIFHVKTVDEGGKKFEKVSRISCSSESHGMKLLLDINSDIYPVEPNEKYSFALAKAKTTDEGVWNQAQQPEQQLLDEYDYAMYGKIFQWEEDESGKEKHTKVTIYASFGGLLMMLKGDASSFANLEPGSRVYIMMRKV